MSNLNSDEIEKLIDSIKNADECEIMEFDFKPVFNALNDLIDIRKHLDSFLKELQAIPKQQIDCQGYFNDELIDKADLDEVIYTLRKD